MTKLIKKKFSNLELMS